ncbi:MAG: IS1634 family transposase [Deltaproteobacteria bacterium]|jgi:transposase|nr:IS1634 family transposase [Deltaproteobacteria bacterium]
MACYLKREVNGTKYISRSVSFRNKTTGKPDNKKTVIGKIDDFTGKIILNKKYLNLLLSSNIDIVTHIAEIESRLGLKKGANIYSDIESDKLSALNASPNIALSQTNSQIIEQNKIENELNADFSDSISKGDNVDPSDVEGVDGTSDKANLSTSGDSLDSEMDKSKFPDQIGNDIINSNHSVNGAKKNGNSNEKYTNNYEFNYGQDDEIIFSRNDIKKLKQINFGTTYLLDQLSKQVGLTQIIMNVFPLLHNQILPLLYYLVSTGKPLMHCEEWIDDNFDFVPSSIMSSQSLSILLQKISETDKINFFEKWLEKRKEKEYVALDITSISSFSELIEDVEYGKSKEDPQLPQINFCLLFGQKSGLPIYYTHFPGSITDVVTLISTLKKISFLSNSSFNIVGDKWFYSKSNIDDLVTNFTNVKFLFSVPIKAQFSKFYHAHANDITKGKYNFVCGNSLIYGKFLKYQWNNKQYLNTYLYYNEDMYNQKKQNLYRDLHQLITEFYDTYNGNIEKFCEINKKYKIYFKFIKRSNYNSSGHYTIQINHTVVEKTLFDSARMIIIGNDNINKIEALEIYRAKDVVEKGFQRFKSALDLRHIRVHTSERMANKEFICFLAQILLSHLDRLMSKHQLYTKYSIQKLLGKFKSLKLTIIKDDSVLNPLSEFQKNIFDLFDINYPDSNTKLLA